MKPTITAPLPQSICFRVTRYCNARCGFCLAPPEGSHPDVKTLISRLDWLLMHGVNTIHFCGGEPTIHPGLPQLIDHVHKHGGKTKLTTNGIKLPDPLLPLLRQTKTQVKVSLHGDQEHHDAVVGRAAFAHTTQNIQRLVAAGVQVSVQTTVVAGASDAISWVTEFCLANKVRRLSLMPFIPRGNGLTSRQDYELSPTQRRALREQVAKSRHNLVGRLDLRWLDFTARPIHVVEADGRLILESATMAQDIELYKIPVPT
ncbi:MAG: radical SAM protein [Methylococcales bacterium]|nr:radical SAM protein [Methylococcales bacterium]